MPAQSTASHRAGDDLIEKATGRMDKLADMANAVRDVAGQAEDIAGRAIEQGREAGERLQEVAGDIKRAVGKSVKDQPMATLAAAAVLGFVLGALWKRLILANFGGRSETRAGPKALCLPTAPVLRLAKPG